MSRIVVVGGINMDLHLFGGRRASSGPALVVDHYLTQPGGKGGNVARAVARLNEIIVFSPRVVEGDALTSVYRVQSGDSLARISSRSKTRTHWRLIQRVNGLSNPNRIRVGQRLKLVQGPFHAVVQKGSFTMDVYGHLLLGQQCARRRGDGTGRPARHLMPPVSRHWCGM